MGRMLVLTLEQALRQSRSHLHGSRRLLIASRKLSQHMTAQRSDGTAMTVAFGMRSEPNLQRYSALSGACGFILLDLSSEN